MHPLEEATRIVMTFLATPFSGSVRHGRRIEQVAEYESERKLPALPA
jgi:ribose 5-phosphate isomerase B